MKRLIVGLLALGSGLLLVTPACDDKPVAPIHDGVAECEAIGEACHAPGDEFGGRYQECHDIGHEGEGEACIAAYDECFELCQAAPMGGAGGAGGEGGGTGHGHGGESGHGHGGESAHGHGGESGHGHGGESGHGHGGEGGGSAGHE